MRPDFSARFESAAKSTRSTMWGPFRCVDGLHLVLFAQGKHEAACALFAETLALIEESIRKESSGEGDQWHLGDFALHTVWRAVETFADRIPAGLRERASRLFTGYLYHFGGLTENHDLLHHAIRFLTGERCPDAVFRDGRPGAVHRDEARHAIRAWVRDYLERGSHEWGAGLYENVNLLSLCNLLDSAGDAEVRSDAKRVLDFLAREIALQAMAGATAGAARRDYGCYRLSTRYSPSRALHWLWFDAPPPEPPYDFVGGVLVAALSDYRPPPETVALARCPGPLRSSDWNTRPFPFADCDIPESFRVTTRLPGAQLSGTIIPAGPSRYTDFTWTAVLGEDAVVFANHPVPCTMAPPLKVHPDLHALFTAYETGAVPEDAHPGWVPGNMPPGMPGDMRPGFWQGHGTAPACWMRNQTLLSLFHLPENTPVSWIHIYLPVAAFDEVRTEGNWIFARKGLGRLRIWTSSPAVLTRKGVWAEKEWRVHGRKTGLAVQIESDTDWEAWCTPRMADRPEWDPSIPAIGHHESGDAVTLPPEASFPEHLLPPRKRSVLLPNPQ